MSAATRETDVAIVGAGAAGLSAGLDLAAAGLDVVVVEARDRVGGRMLNADLGGGAVVEMGGQWIGPGQDAIASLAADLGVATFPTYYDGEHLATVDGEVVRHADPFPPLGPGILEQADLALQELQAMAARVPVDAPWDAPDADALDTISFASWMREHIGSPEVRAIVGLIGDIQATPSAELSLLWALFALACSKDFDTMTSVVDGAQQDRFVGGSQIVAVRAAERLGDAVELDAPVRSIHTVDGAVRVVTSRLDVVARRVIVTVPPVLAARIAFDPPLPPDKDAALTRMLPGSVIKVNVVYDEPFWRDEGLSGQWIDPGRPFEFCLDNSPPDGSCGVLVGFFESAAARRLSTAPTDERRAAALDSLAAAFGPRAREAERYLDLDWSAEPWTRGCYAGKPAIGATVAFGRALRRVDGPIHWAGSEMATMWNGYIDGAVSSGREAAREVLEALG